jgi:FtsZ-binding cell division protein ZapB
LILFFIHNKLTNHNNLLQQQYNELKNQYELLSNNNYQLKNQHRISDNLEIGNPYKI